MQLNIQPNYSIPQNNIAFGKKNVFNSKLPERIIRIPKPIVIAANSMPSVYTIKNIKSKADLENKMNIQAVIRFVKNRHRYPHPLD